MHVFIVNGFVGEGFVIVEGKLSVDQPPVHNLVEPETKKVGDGLGAGTTIAYVSEGEITKGAYIG